MYPNSHPLLQQRRKALLSEINVVPYIDVMLVLLVIFMVTTPLLSQGIKVNLPQAQTQTITSTQEPIIVSIDEKGFYYLNTLAHPQKPLTIQQLKQKVDEQLKRVAEKKAPQQIFIKGDKKIDYGKVISLMVLLQRAGAINIGLLTESPPQAV